jgi:hypothetical protein
MSVSNSIFPILILKSVKTTVEAAVRAVKEVLPVVDIAEAFKVTFPSEAESFVQELTISASKAKIEIFFIIVFLNY